MSEADYSVGRRVYNGASNAPTRGTVDPMGYIDREMNKPGSTGPSDSRSGLAAAALRRLQGNGGAGPQAGGPPGAGGSSMGGPPGFSEPPPDPALDGLMGAPISSPPIMTMNPMGQIVLKQSQPMMPGPMADPMIGGMPPGMPSLPDPSIFQGSSSQEMM